MYYSLYNVTDFKAFVTNHRKSRHPSPLPCLGTKWIPLILHRCEVALGEFLREIKKSPEKVNFADMVNIVVVHSTSSGKERTLVKEKNN